MRKILKFFDEFIYGSHLLSLGASGIVLSTLLIFDLRINLLILIIAYLIYQLIYTYNHYRELQFDIKTNPERAKHLNSKKTWIQFSPFLYSIFLCISLVFTNLLTILLSVFILVGGILYTEYFKKVQILGFKSYYVAFFWSILVLLIPLAYNLKDFIPYIFLSVFTFIRWIVNTVFFDIKDIESDREEDIKTFPVFWGKKKTIFILYIVNLLSLIPILLGRLVNLPIISLFLSGTVLISLFYLTKALYLDKKKLRLISYTLVDGEYLLWPLLVLIGRLFLK